MNRWGWYLTVYPPRPDVPASDDDELIGMYGSHVWAKGERHAKSLAKRRNIGEHIVGRVLSSRKNRPDRIASDILSKRSLSPKDKMDVMHAATFLGYLLMQSGIAQPCDVLGDEGLLHQIVHTLIHGQPRRKDLVAVVRHFEAKVPGYLAT